MSDLDLTPLTEILAEYAHLGRTALLPALQSAQSIYGYLPEKIAAEVGRALGVPLADVYGVIDFYTMLYRQPIGKTIVRVCNNPPCSLEGGSEVLAALCRNLNIDPNQMTPDGTFTVERAPCLGLCDHAPAALLEETAIAHIQPSNTEGILHSVGGKPRSIVAGDLRLLTSNCGRGRPNSLVDYLSAGGYQGLNKALSMSPQAVIEEVNASGLVGRGGAAFPTGLKWRGAAESPGEPKYIVCNADESEPGTFKDRILMEDD